MRTTLKLDDDVAVAVKRLQAEAGVGVSEAVNRPIRAGLVKASTRSRYVHQTSDLGLKIDVGDIAGVLELLDRA